MDDAQVGKLFWLFTGLKEHTVMCKLRCDTWAEFFDLVKKSYAKTRVHRPDLRTQQNGIGTEREQLNIYFSLVHKKRYRNREERERERERENTTFTFDISYPQL